MVTAWTAAALQDSPLAHWVVLVQLPLGLNQGAQGSSRQAAFSRGIPLRSSTSYPLFGVKISFKKEARAAKSAEAQSQSITYHVKLC